MKNIKKITLSLLTTGVFASLFCFVSFCYGFTLNIKNNIKAGTVKSGSWIHVKNICQSGVNYSFWSFTDLSSGSHTVSIAEGGGINCVLDYKYGTSVDPESIGLFADFIINQPPTYAQQVYCHADEATRASASKSTKSMDITLYTKKEKNPWTGEDFDAPYCTVTSVAG